MTLTQQVAYLAGIIDGEGCLQLVRSGGYKRAPKVPRLDITNYNREMLDVLRARHGGNIYKKLKHGRGYCLVLQGKQLVHWLRLVEPILIAKRPQAQVILNLLRDERELQGALGIKQWGKRPIPPEVRAWREEAERRLRELKQQSVGKEKSLQESSGYIGEYLTETTPREVSVTP